MSRADAKFGITDTGEFVESTYRCEESSSLYGKLIGRRKVVLPSQKAFTTADIAIEGYLKKEGSWRKSWKTRYFILRKDIRTLCIFTSKDDYTLIGAIPLGRNSMIFGDLRVGEEDHVFGVRHGQDQSPEILMSAPDAETKQLWLKALIREAQRTDEVVLVDWWSDMFGDVPTLTGRAIAELIKGRRANGQVQNCHVSAIAVDTPPSDMPTFSPIGDDVETADDVSGMARMALMSFAVPSEEEFFGSVDTVRLAMPDQDSDDELQEPLPPMTPFLGSQKSNLGSTQFVEAPRRRSSDSRPGSTDSPSQKESTAHLLASRGVSNNSDEQMSSNIISPGKATGGKSKERRKDPMKKAMDSVAASEVKDSKQKPIGPPPLQYPTAERHITRHGFSGLKLSIRIENMCQYMDRFFIVIFAGHSATNQLNGPNIGPVSEQSTGVSAGLSWIPLSRTEEICVEDKPEYGESVIRVANHQFSLLQGPMENESASHFMFILFRNEHQKSNGGTGYNFSDNILVSKITLKREVLDTAGGLFKFDMTVMSDRFLDLSSSPWMLQRANVTLGVAVLSSPKLEIGRRILQKQINSFPYGESAYGLRSSNGLVLVVEELFVSKYAISVPQSYLNLIFLERMQQMSDVALVAKDDFALLSRNLNELTSDVLMDYFADTTIAPPKIPPHLLVQPASFNNFTRVPTDGLGMTELTIRVAALKKLCSTLERMNRIVFEYYENSYRHYLRISAGGILRNAVIGAELGGSFLRRSVWKKTPTWQFAPVNLNIQILMSQTIRTSELKAAPETIQQIRGKFTGESAELAPQSEVQYFPSVTHGAFAAHSLGFNEGGLRRIFSKVSPDEIKLEWMQGLQLSGGLKYSALEPLIKEFPDHAESLFSLSSQVDDPAEFYSRAFNLALRIDICLSQALSHSVTCLKILVMLASLGLTEYVEKLRCALMAGYLIPIESLLSSQGHEMGMIEDLDGILPLLNSVSFRFVKPVISSTVNTGNGGALKEAGNLIDGVNILRDVKGRLVVDISVSLEEESIIRSCSADIAGYEEWSSSSAYRCTQACKFKEMPRCNYKIGHAIPEIIATMQVFAVMFTQGVNEMQTLANMSGDAYKQAAINADSITKLHSYTAGYIDALKYLNVIDVENSRNAGSGVRKAKIVALDADDSTPEPSSKINDLTRLYKELDKTVQATITSPNEKNVNVLLNASRIGRFISGSMSILCKSGKDRTSMSVTLEQTRYLAELNEIQGGKDLCRVMRRHGVRRMNVWANTGQSLYAFNSIQRQILPTCYAPPEGTFSGSVMS